MRQVLIRRFVNVFLGTAVLLTLYVLVTGRLTLDSMVFPIVPLAAIVGVIAAGIRVLFTGARSLDNRLASQTMKYAQHRAQSAASSSSGSNKSTLDPEMEYCELLTEIVPPTNNRAPVGLRYYDSDKPGGKYASTGEKSTKQIRKQLKREGWKQISTRHDGVASWYYYQRPKSGAS